MDKWHLQRQIKTSQGQKARQFKQERLMHRTDAEVLFDSILEELKKEIPNFRYSVEQVFHVSDGKFYIADFFVAYPYKIVFEIDGGVHYGENSINKDVARTLYFESDRGYKVFRFPNTEVLNNGIEVKNKVKDIVEKYIFHFRH